ncbi:MAG: hypothetical protein WBL53_10070 [Pseudonocardiaceae bacterium]
MDEGNRQSELTISEFQSMLDHLLITAGSDSVWVTYVRQRIAELKARQSHEVFDREAVDGAA